ncbi:hypothetical protein [Solidesulfovibrio sp.]|uniref:hypothetical protein n=1 Tax=Solidesulfovibrio sp. TaxID=2910990 RepID=UPI002638E512|nr:hypothetical protein [Solidesulfovibrio sp.]
MPQMKVRALRPCYLNDQLFAEGQETVLDLPEDHPMLDHFEVLSPKRRGKKVKPAEDPETGENPPDE